MKLAGFAILASAVLAACAERPSDPAAGAPSPTGPTAESTVLSVVGTPFLIAFKVPLCVATVLAAAPASAGAAVIPPEDNPQQGIARQVLADGVRDNCGPPYVVSP